jgi:hypothetical protein
MRNVLWLLFFISLSASAARIILTPMFAPTTGLVSIKDDNFCKMQARVAEKSIRDAKIAIPLDETLDAWDSFVADNKNHNTFNAADMARFKNMIVLAFQLTKKYPDVPSVSFGDHVYSACLVAASKDNKIKI